MKKLISKKTFRIIGVISALLFTGLHAEALDKDGNGPLRNEAVALYRFNSANFVGGKIQDQASAAHGSPLNLVLVRKDGSSLVPYSNGDFVESGSGTYFRSETSADKIVNACSASGEMTIEAWISSSSKSQLKVHNEDGQNPPIKQSLRIISLGDTYFREFGNFGLYQAYNNADVYKASFRTTGNSSNDNIEGAQQSDNVMLSDVGVLAVDQLQHVIITRSKGGRVSLYVSDKDGNDSLVSEFSEPRSGDFSNWMKSATSVSYDTPTDASGKLTRSLDVRLAIGNEPSGVLDMASKPNSSASETFQSRNYPWAGKLYMVAIFCKALTPVQVLGVKAPRTDLKPSFPIDLNLNITPSLKRAQAIYNRLSGVRTPLVNPVLKQMADLLDKGEAMEAASVAVGDSGVSPVNSSFYNITVRDFAAPMSNREETLNVPLNDFSATVVGVVRDNINAKELLNGNFYYQGDPLKAAVPSNLINDLLTSNRHYEALETGEFDLYRVLTKKQQMVYNGTNQAVPHPDPAGLITTRAFMSAHAIAGTNRRLIEYTFREFMCAPIEKWANASGSDGPIGRDIDRFPGGSHTKFTQTCRSCHSRMDPLRGAFAYFTFSNNFVKHSLVVPSLPFNDQNEDTSAGMRTGLRQGDAALTSGMNLGNVNYVTVKLNHNDHVYPGGRVITDDSFENAATDEWSQKFFGWRGPMSGKGVRQLGAMVAESKNFSNCMARRVFASVCKREVQNFDENLISQAATEFEANNYNLKFLFKRLVIAPECIGN